MQLKLHQDLGYITFPGYVIKGPGFSCPGLTSVETGIDDSNSSWSPGITKTVILLIKRMGLLVVSNTICRRNYV